MAKTKTTVIRTFAAACVSVCLSTAAAMLPAAVAFADEAEVTVLFVQGAKSMQADTEAKTLRLSGVSEHTIYFSDRPTRVAGLVETVKFVEHWATGNDSFASNPPNATLMVYDAEAGKDRASVLVLSDPVLEGDDLIYAYDVLGGTVPASGGATGLFIDTFGPGGGVGAGFHGVGVGARGPGVAGWRGVAAVNECEATNSC